MLFRSENKLETAIALFLVLIGVSLRLLPHPDNFAPVSAIALFSGVALSAPLALTVPLVVMVISDLIMGPHALFPLTWGCFALVTLLGLYIRKDASAVKILAGTLGGSVIFFLVTNLGVFIFQNMYPKTSAGLAQCFVMALPFFRNTALGDLFFSFVFFSSFALAKNFSHKFVSQKN